MTEKSKEINSIIERVTKVKLKKDGTPDRRFFPNHVRKKKCKSVKQLTPQEIEGLRKKAVEQTLISVVKASAYHYNMLLSLQQQFLCLEAQLKIFETKLKILEEKLK